MAQQKSMPSFCDIKNCLKPLSAGQKATTDYNNSALAPYYNKARPADNFELQSKNPYVTAASRGNKHILLAQAGNTAVPGAKAAVTDPISDSLLSNDSRIAIGGLRKVGRMKKKDADIYLPMILMLAQSSILEVQYEAAVALGKIGIVTSEIIELLVMQRTIEFTLGPTNSKGKIGVTVTVHYTFAQLREKEEDHKTEKKFAQVANYLCKKAPDIAIPALIKLLDSLHDIYGRDSVLSILETLGELGPIAKPAIPSISARLKSEQGYVRGYAAHALGEIGKAAQSEAYKIVDLLTNDQAAFVRADAARALGKLGKLDLKIEMALVNAKKNDPDEKVRKAANEALIALRKAAR